MTTRVPAPDDLDDGAVVHCPDGRARPVQEGGVVFGYDDAAAALAAEWGVSTGSDGCPWCDGYDGEHVAQHAVRAHPDEWDDYNE